MEIIYWIILFLLIIGVWILKRNSNFILYPAFMLFLVSAILTVLGFRNFAETLMRVSLIFWIVGIVQALFEYRKSPQ